MNPRYYRVTDYASPLIMRVTELRVYLLDNKISDHVLISWENNARFEQYLETKIKNKEWEPIPPPPVK